MRSSAFSKLLPLCRASLIVSATFPLTVISNAYADDQEDLLSLYDEDEIIEIATGTKKSIRFAPSVATVIDKEEIKASGARFLREALEQVTSLHIGQGILLADYEISIRGIDSSNNPHVLVLIDGVQVKSLFSAARPASFRLPTSSIERIEVIRGPGSAVYGADAYAGVINVVTKDGESSTGTSVGSRLGTFNTQDAWVSYGKNHDDGTFYIGYDYTRSDGDHNRIVARDGFGNSGLYRDEYEIHNLTVKGAYKHLDYNFLLHNLINGGNAVGGAYTLDPQGRINADWWQGNLSYTFEASEDSSLEISTSYGEGDFFIENVLIPPNMSVDYPAGMIGNPGIDQKTLNVDIVGLNSGIANHVFRIGLGYRLEDADSSEVKNFDSTAAPVPFGPGFLPGPFSGTPPQLRNVSNDPNNIFLDDVSRELYYVSVQDEWRFSDDWELTLGVRFDEYNDVGSTINPRAALVWAKDYNATLKVLAGRAFRPPSFTELFAQNNPTQNGNADLDPETIDTYEIDFEYMFSADSSLHTTLFYYEAENLIELDSAFQFQNHRDQEGLGIELEYRRSLNTDVKLEINATYQDIEDSNTHMTIAEVPRIVAYGAIHIDVANASTISLDVNYIGKRNRAVGDSRNGIGDLSIMNMALNSELVADTLDLDFSIKNIFDEKAYEPSTFSSVLPFVQSDYPVIGRYLSLGLTYHLN